MARQTIKRVQGFLVLSGIVVLLFFTLRTLFAGKTAKSGKSLGGAKTKHGILKIDENQIDKGRSALGRVG